MDKLVRIIMARAVVATKHKQLAIHSIVISPLKAFGDLIFKTMHLKHDL
jgi:hypothetical protein